MREPSDVSKVLLLTLQQERTINAAAPLSEIRDNLHHEFKRVLEEFELLFKKHGDIEIEELFNNRGWDN